MSQLLAAPRKARYIAGGVEISQSNGNNVLYSTTSTSVFTVRSRRSIFGLYYYHRYTQ